MHEESMRQAALSSSVSERAWINAEKVVEFEYDNENWDSIFKGKWYGYLLASQIEASAPNRIDTKHLAASLVKHVAASMGFDSAWSIRVQASIVALASAHGLGVTQQVPQG